MLVNPRYAPFLQPFSRTTAEIQRQPWFAEGWRVCSGPFQDGEGVFLGLWKEGWFNEDFRGIHFEASLDGGGYNLKHVVCAMHVLHRDVFPGTQKDRNAFSVPFVTSLETRRIVRSWKAGYRINPKGGMVPLRLNAPRTDHNLEEVLLQELYRLQQLGPEIDRVIRDYIS